MSEIAGFIGWCLSSFHGWIARDGLSRRRTAAILLAACALSAALVALAWPGGFPS